MTRRLLHLALAATLLTAGACQPASLTTAPTGPAAAQSERFALSGVAAFDDRTAQIAPNALTRLATVTLIDAANRTVATTRTDAAGAFTLLPGAAFVAADGEVFFLDAYKGTRDNAVGADVARLRTILQWTSTGWKSVSSAGVVVNPLTTAVSVIQGLLPGSVSAVATLDTVSGASVTTGNGTLNGNWSATLGLVRDLLARDQDPLARIIYRDAAFRVAPNKAAPLVVENFRSGTFSETQVDGTGDLLLSAPRPNPNDPASELDYFSCAGVAPDTAGTVVSDGTYLYVKSWNSYYAGSTRDVFKRIGTGFNGTTRGAYYGTLGPATATSFGAAYCKGYIYISISNNPTQLQQLSVSTGTLSTIDLPTPLFNRDLGDLNVAGDRRYLITSDGTYVYNLSFGIGGTQYNGYTVQVFDPSQGFRLVRHFTMNTTSFYADGVMCDGTYLYPVEWKTPSARISRYRLADGAHEATWTFIQDGQFGAYNPSYNSPIAGAWDPVNRVFWLGNVDNEKVHLMRGGNYIPSGTWQSATLDTGAASPYFNRLTWKGELNGNNGLSFQVRSAASPAALAAATWYGPTSTTDAYTASGMSLNPIHNKNRYLQIRATLASSDLKTSPTLSQLSVEVMP